MTKSEDFDSIFLEFPPITKEDWERVILADLKGGDYQKKLVWTNQDGIDVQPYYTHEVLQGMEHLDLVPGEYPFLRGNHRQGNPWLIRQDVSLDNGIKEAIKKAEYLLDQGVESINFVSENPDTIDVESLVNGIDFTQAEYHFDGLLPDRVLSALENGVHQGAIAPETVRGGIGWDPISNFMLTGLWPDEEQSFDYLASCIKEGSQFPHLRFIDIHANHFKHAGSTIMQELTFGLAQGNEYLAELVERGIAIEELASRITFRFCVGPNYFFEIAKFRVARLLWTKILTAYELQSSSAAQMNIHAESSIWNKSVYDPYNNLLRTTTEGMSAILGGVHSLTLKPFDFTYQKSNEFSERLARNQQLLLREEAYFDKVADPAGGSYYIESITQKMGEIAWKMFQEIESKGGFTECFYAGWIQDKIVTSAQLRDEAVACRKEILLGTNQYPDASEEAMSKVDLSYAKSPVPSSYDVDAQPLILYRGPEAFESLRLATEKSGKRPRVFMLTIGNLAMRRARAGFAGNFFGCAGYEIVDNNGFDSVELGCQEALNAHADLVVLCSSDEEYETLAPKAAKLLKEKTLLVVAGYPEKILDTLMSEGIEHFIHAKSNLLLALQEFNRLLGIGTDHSNREE